MYAFHAQFTTYCLTTYCRHFAHMAVLAGGLLFSMLGVKQAHCQTAEIDSGVVAGQFELLQPDKGDPPRPPIVRESSNNNEETSSGRDQELSVEPGSQPLLPEDAPAWVGAPANASGDVHYLYVSGQIADSESEAAELIDDELVAAVCRYTDQTLLDTASTGSHPGELGRDLEATERLASRAAGLLRKKVTADFIWKNMVDDPTGYTARLNVSGIPMFQKWITVSITPEQRAMIMRWDREARQSARLAPVGVGVLGLLGSVGLLHLIIRGRKPRP